jgi:hypothetical protein
MEKLFTSGPVSGSRFRFFLVAYQMLAIVGGLGTVGKVGLLHGAHGAVRTALLILLYLWILLALFWRVALRYRRLLAPIALLGLIVVPPLVFPQIEKMHSVGRGSDQPDCIIVASDRLLHRQWPYDSSLVWSHNPLSCGPGWVALQAPVVQSLHYPVAAVLLFVIPVIVMTLTMGWDIVAGFLSLLLLAPGVWVAASDGTDFLTFGFCAAALSLATGNGRAAQAGRSPAGTILRTLLLGLVAQFRVATLMLPATLGQSIGTVRAVLATLLAVVVEAAFLGWWPAKFIGDGPMHILGKSTGIDLSQEASIPLIPLIAGFVTVAAVLTVFTLWLSRRIPVPDLLLGYLLFIFALPALANLLSEWRHYGLSFHALGVWEGGNWMTGCTPLAAMFLAATRRTAVESAEVSSLEKVETAV